METGAGKKEVSHSAARVAALLDARRSDIAASSGPQWVLTCSDTTHPSSKAVMRQRELPAEGNETAIEPSGSSVVDGSIVAGVGGLEAIRLALTQT